MQGAQTGTAGGLLKGGGVGVAHQQAAQFVVHYQQFGDGAAAVVAPAVEQDRALFGQAIQAMFGDQFGRCFKGNAGGRVIAPISTPVRWATSPASRTMGCNLSTKRLTAVGLSVPKLIY